MEIDVRERSQPFFTGMEASQALLHAGRQEMEASQALLHAGRQEMEASQALSLRCLLFLLVVYSRPLPSPPFLL